MGQGFHTPKKCLLKFFPHGCGASPFHICAPSTSLDGCGFFNSVVVTLPFNSISDIYEWWLFCILVAIFMWLWEEASHVCLHCHLDRKLPFLFERKDGGERETLMWGTSIGCLLICAWTRDRTNHNPCMCPDEELKPQTFSFWMTLQPSEPHWPGHYVKYFKNLYSIDENIR